LRSVDWIFIILTPA